MTQEVKEVKNVTMNLHASADGLPDMDITWYDFGGGVSVAPNIPGECFGDSLVALHCVRNGKYFFKVIEGNHITDEDLPELYERYAPEFKKEVEEKTQEMTQNE